MAKVKSHFTDELEARRAAADDAAGFGLYYDNWTDSYRDRFNDVFVSRPRTRKLWTVASREAGNQTLIHSRHRNVECAFIAAKAVIDARCAKTGLSA